jgi:hypothetical protein
MERSTREEWATRVAKWQESGLSAPAFAAQIGVKSKTLIWWRANLVRLATTGSPKRALARSRDAGNASPPVKSLQFVEMTPAIESEPLEVVLPTSVRIRVRRGFDSQTLARLLDVLESRR